MGFTIGFKPRKNVPYHNPTICFLMKANVVVLLTMTINFLSLNLKYVSTHFYVCMD